MCDFKRPTSMLSGSAGRFLFIVHLMLLPLTASAVDLRYRCEAECRSCYGWDEADPVCQNQRSACINSCMLHSPQFNSSRTQPHSIVSRQTLPQSKYAAIVYDTATGQWAAASGFTNPDAVKKDTVDACRNIVGVKACDWQGWALNQCLALAAADNGKGLKGFRDPSRDAAEKLALKACEEASGVACRVRVWACASGGYGGNDPPHK